MFFPKLRRRAKWVFLLLAIVFGGGFLLFGVGTGVQGGNLGDAFQDIFGGDDVAGPSVAEARERVAENPDDPEAQLALANALQAHGQREEAIRTLEEYTTANPDDVGALRQLAALYDLRALDARRRGVEAQIEAQQQLVGQAFQPARTPFEQELARDPIAESLAARANERANRAFEEMQRAYQREAEVYRRLTLVVPDEPALFLQLGQASQFAGDVETAITAYERFLELSPDDANAPIVEEQLEQLRGTGAGRSG